LYVVGYIVLLLINSYLFIFGFYKCKINIYRQFGCFPLISPGGIVSINRLTLILESISQSDVKHIMALSIGLAAILVIIFVSTLKTAIILYTVKLLKGSPLLTNNCHCVT